MIIACRVRTWTTIVAGLPTVCRLPRELRRPPVGTCRDDTPDPMPAWRARARPPRKSVVIVSWNGAFACKIRPAPIRVRGLTVAINGGACDAGPVGSVRNGETVDREERGGRKPFFVRPYLVVLPDYDRPREPARVCTVSLLRVHVSGLVVVAVDEYTTEYNNDNNNDNSVRPRRVYERVRRRSDLVFSTIKKPDRDTIIIIIIIIRLQDRPAWARFTSLCRARSVKRAVIGRKTRPEARVVGSTTARTNTDKTPLKRYASELLDTFSRHKLPVSKTDSSIVFGTFFPRAREIYR